MKQIAPRNSPLNVNRNAERQPYFAPSHPPSTNPSALPIGIAMLNTAMIPPRNRWGKMSVSIAEATGP